MIMLSDIDMVQVYTNKRLAELEDMIAVYHEAGCEPTVDLLARRAELERLESKLKEYRDVQEADD